MVTAQSEAASSVGIATLARSIASCGSSKPQSSFRMNSMQHPTQPFFVFCVSSSAATSPTIDFVLFSLRCEVCASTSVPLAAGGGAPGSSGTTGAEALLATAAPSAAALPAGLTKLKISSAIVRVAVSLQRRPQAEVVAPRSIYLTTRSDGES